MRVEEACCISRTPEVAVVIPIHNGSDLTARCLASIRASSVSPSQVIVVDDGSTDGSADVIRKGFPEVVVLRGSGSLWWSASMNAGARRAFADGASHVLSLNNDCVMSQQSLEMLCRRAASAEVGLICSKVRNWPEDGRLISAGGAIDWWLRGPFLRGAGEIDDGRFDSVALVDWVPGMGVLIPRECYESVGGYDSRRFPHYMGDIDFALRVKNRGYSLYYEPASLIWNDKTQTGLATHDLHSLREVWRVLFHRRSKYNLPENLPFYYRHCPAPAWLTGFGWRYRSVVAGFFRSLASTARTS